MYANAWRNFMSDLKTEPNRIILWTVWIFEDFCFVSTTTKSQGDTKYRGGGSDNAVIWTSASLVALPFQTFIRNFYIWQLSAWFILTELCKVYLSILLQPVFSQRLRTATLGYFLLQLAFGHSAFGQNRHHFLIEHNVHIPSENAILKALHVNFYSSNDYYKTTFHISVLKGSDGGILH